jgi:N-dimethylarginine dimethylaminohydrolase
MIINSNNGWDQLEEVIVGRADNARTPNVDASMRNFMYANKEYEELYELPGQHKKETIDQGNEDLDILSDVLEDCGIKVHRPYPDTHWKTIQTPYWKTTGWYNYCPRDLILVLNDTLIETPSSMRSRMFETYSYRDIMYEAFHDGAKLISAPKPMLTDDNYDFSDLSVPTLMNKEILFDAANIVRMGKDILYQISNSGNKLGAEWLQRTFPEYRVHTTEKSYSGAHIDSTITPLRPGLVLLNADRCSKDSYPQIFKSWDKIFFNDWVSIDYDGIAVCENAIALNILSINEKLAIVDEDQKPLMKVLYSHGIESIPLKLRPTRTLGGGFHCVTLDLKREGTLENYFD